MTQHVEEARKLETEWRYEIQYGPEGEANYAWIYKGDLFVATMRTHHAVEIVKAISALAAAEERGRIEERERCAIETGGVLVEMPTHPPNLMARVLAYLEGSDPKATSGGERNSDLRDGVWKVLEASK